MDIAVVGGGVSGLVTAYLLAPTHKVTLFESADYPGGHTNTIRVDTADNTYWVDTGFIVFNDRTYPLFEKLLRRLGVGWQPSNMSFSVTDDQGDFEYASTGLNGLFAKRSHLAQPSYYRMLQDLNRFHKEAHELLGDESAGPSFGDWLEAKRFSRAFIDKLIVPQASAVWSADPKQMWSFPAKFLAEFFDNHGMLAVRGRPQWRTVVGGSHSYVKALVRETTARIELAAPVKTVTRFDDHVLVTPVGATPQRFDEVVFACHSDQALRMLSDATPLERELLGALPYQPNEAVLHTDASLLPRRKRAWASWNYHLLDDPPAKTTVTYHMNRLQSLRADREFCVTLNHTAPIDPASIIKTIQYSHPVFTEAGRVAQTRHKEISGQNRTHYAGAYWGWGFHEDGVRSAVRVAEALGVDGPVTHSAIYTGSVHHRRRAVRPHAFRYRLALHYIDLDEVDTLLGGRLVRPGFGVVRFRRADYLGDPSQPLADAVRAHVAHETGLEVDGPVRLLTQLRSFGHCFNPVSFYYCFDRYEQVAAIVAEVTNTPWGERHAYVLCPDATGALSGSFPKRLHVSPFFGMNQTYEWRSTSPAERIVIHLDNVEDGERVFDATLSLTRHPFDAATVRSVSRRYPAASLRTLALIYGHAAALRAKGVRLVKHPGASTREPTRTR